MTGDMKPHLRLATYIFLIILGTCTPSFLRLSLLFGPDPQVTCGGQRTTDIRYIMGIYDSVCKNRTSDGSSATPLMETSVLDSLAFKKAVRALGGALCVLAGLEYR